MYTITIKNNEIIQKSIYKNDIKLSENQKEITKVIYDSLRLPAIFDLDENNTIINIINAPEPPEFTNLIQIDEAVVSKIRELYSIDNEFKMQRMGILDSTNAEFIAYCVYVEECRAWGQAKKLELEG